jgi:hypothetical protein
MRQLMVGRKLGGRFGDVVEQVGHEELLRRLQQRVEEVES